MKPTYSALISDTFGGDKWGVLADWESSEHIGRTNHVNIQGWIGVPDATTGFASLSTPVAPGTPAWFIQDYGIYQEHTDDKRTGGRRRSAMASERELDVHVGRQLRP